jgi:hypothetical protein
MRDRRAVQTVADCRRLDFLGPFYRAAGSFAGHRARSGEGTGTAVRRRADSAGS